MIKIKTQREQNRFLKDIDQKQQCYSQKSPNWVWDPVKILLESSNDSIGFRERHTITVMAETHHLLLSYLIWSVSHPLVTATLNMCELANVLLATAVHFNQALTLLLVVWFICDKLYCLYHLFVNSMLKNKTKKKSSRGRKGLCKSSVRDLRQHYPSWD